MSDKLITSIYEITKKIHDPVSNQALDQNNPNLNIACNKGHANIAIKINPKDKLIYEDLSIEIKKALNAIKELLSINIIFTSENISAPQSEELAKNKRFKINAKKIIAIASGKGGVGKSTFAVNFATALKKQGFSIGILDADIYGPSVPRMMGISGRPQANEENKLIPLENYGVKCMSIGFLIGVDTPTIWRGPMIMKALEQMYNGVEWGKLDYLIIDLPPGTGDAQLTLAQNSKLTGTIIVSTPQDVALNDVRKGINMFKKVGVPVLGIVENMSYFICSNCNERHEIFSNGGAKQEAENFKTSFLGELPIDKKLRIHSDEGQPVCISEPDSPISKIYMSIAKTVHTNLN